MLSRIVNNKKGSDGGIGDDVTERSVLYMVFSFCLCGIMIYFLLQMYYYIGDAVNIDPQIGKFAAGQQLASCVASDGIPGSSIDMRKFTQEGLNLCYSSNPEAKIAYILELKIEDEQRKIHTDNWVEEKPFSNSKPATVIVKKEDESIEGVLSIGEQIVS
ncbi:MAG TPA: hypothetical protein VFF28_00925 [Candidatus Nanoarchaeia archaeon]|nr:hypothetical protein [Candidatus Nanoarchaeia archaeon]